MNGYVMLFGRAILFYLSMNNKIWGTLFMSWFCCCALMVEYDYLRSVMQIGPFTDLMVQIGATG